MKGLGSLIIVFVAAITLSSCAQSSDSASMEGSLAHSIYTKIMERRTDYDDLTTNQKVLAACINWQGTGKNYVDVRYTYAYYESEFTERFVGASFLMAGAINGCENGKKKHNLDCDCVAVDRNGSPALRVPKSVSEPASAKPGKFDGNWDGTMACGTCSNCPGPLQKPVTITVANSEFDFAPDHSYVGIGNIDSQGNVEIRWTPYAGNTNSKKLWFEGKITGDEIELHGERGLRECTMTLSRVNP